MKPKITVLSNIVNNQIGDDFYISFYKKVKKEYPNCIFDEGNKVYSIYIKFTNPDNIKQYEYSRVVYTDINNQIIPQFTYVVNRFRYNKEDKPRYKAFLKGEKSYIDGEVFIEIMNKYTFVFTEALLIAAAQYGDMTLETAEKYKEYFQNNPDKTNFSVEFGDKLIGLVKERLKEKEEK